MSLLLLFNTSPAIVYPNQTAFSTSRVPSQVYFNHFNSNYDNERFLYDLLLAEAYNKHGVCCSYIKISYDLNYDKLFKEDNNRTIERRFNIMAYFDLPRETKTFSNAGIGWSEIFHIFLSKAHFNVASTCDASGNLSAYPPYIPQVSDILETQYNGVFYEIISVKDAVEVFLQGKHSWDIVVRIFRDKHLNVSPDTSGTMTDLLQYVNQSDLFNIGNFINQENNTIAYQPAISECPPKDPFNEWWNN